MIAVDEQIKEMTADEYFYLTENLEVINYNTVEAGREYILVNRKNKLYKIVDLIMENELTPFERDLISDYLIKGLSVSRLTEKFGVSRSSAYRTIKAVKNKIYTLMKYVLIYDSEPLPKSVDELQSFIKRRNNVEH